MKKIYIIKSGDDCTLHFPIKDNYFDKVGIDLNNTIHKSYDSIDDCPLFINGKFADDPTKFYFDGDEVKIDNDFSVKLMPVNVIKTKYFNKLKDKIDNELSKDVPNLLEIAKSTRELEKSKSYPNPSWYEKALEGLDNRVSGGEPDKPVIRQKLQEKLDAIKKG